MAKFQMMELTGEWALKSSRLGSGLVSAGGGLLDADMGKFVKLVGESRYGLSVLGDELEGWITSIEPASADGYAFGAVCRPDACFKAVTFSGLQATPGTAATSLVAPGTLGTGALAVGDYVLVGNPLVWVNQAMSGPATVCKATDQSVTSIARIGAFAARVVSLGNVGTGAPGTTGIIEFIS